MKRENISDEALCRIQYSIVDKVNQYRKLQDSGYVKQANELRQYIHGMMAILTALGYDVEYTESGEAIVISMSF